MNRINFFLIAALIATLSNFAHAQDAPKLSAKGIKSSAVGAWLHEYDWQESKVRDVFRIKSIDKNGKVTGALYRNDDKPRPLQKATFKNGKLSFVVSGNQDGTDWLTRYEGKIDDNTIDGTVVLEANDQKWDWAWKPVRVLELMDVAGSWQLKIETPDGNVFDPVLKIKKENKKYKGNYVSKLVEEIELSDLRIENDQLCWKIAFEYDGTDVQIEYKGSPQNGKMTGIFNADAAGQKVDGEFTASLMKK